MMEKKIVVVYQMRKRCSSCDKEIVIFWECPSDGFGYEAQLYECNNCQELYYHSGVEMMRKKPLEKELINVNCEKCHQPLSETLKKKKMFSQCPYCHHENKEGHRLGVHNQTLETKKAIFHIFS